MPLTQVFFHSQHRLIQTGLKMEKTEPKTKIHRIKIKKKQKSKAKPRNSVTDLRAFYFDDETDQGVCRLHVAWDSIIYLKIKIIKITKENIKVTDMKNLFGPFNRIIRIFEEQHTIS